MSVDTMRDLFVDELKDLWSAENQILKALPRMIKAVSSDELRVALEEHARVTEGHVQRLEQIAASMGEKTRGKKCVGMEGLLEEGKEVLREEIDEEVLDAAIIGAAQKVEHYEIAGYGTARAHAEHLGQNEAAALLQQTLDEEREADEKLTMIAESFVNALATDEEDEEPMQMGMAGSPSRRR